MSTRRKILDPQTGEPKWGTTVEIAEAREPVARIVLENGVVARLKLAVLEVVRMDDSGPDGAPSYNFNTQVIANIHHPEDSGK